MVLEAIADEELRIWGCHFGRHGNLNDMNVLDSSPLVRMIMQGKIFPSFGYELNGRKHNGLYFLVDGIYLHWAIFVCTISDPGTRKERLFVSAQEAVRKDVERAFGVLLARWALLMNLCMLHDRDVASKTVRAAVVLYNIVVESLRNVYVS